MNMMSDEGLLTLSAPDSADGFGVHQLIARCKPLDENSVYCNLLQCDHFSATSVIAKRGDDVVGFISGYLIPDRPDTLFVWQVAIDESARGQGLATKMLRHILGRPALSGVQYLETTITADNDASWALFTRYAEKMNAQAEKTEHYGKESHFNGEHDSEWLYRIGPFNA
ncbi:diaminobutyrate acetyltransferase [Reinekea blandensis]|uniref:L-2,4-diaminobutyric acid acetyltransferase n=1 Tax=Reinekea blandensis MED297 TaxID=314283 RepID=A4BFE2_9GAMM|nr:diaminobutyrate acetyltransferase [Reinekea blandensis]EAR09255.1 Histone acetyltransferase HPA2/related acetyltransferase [Reinekea sp. MED297] [Reinekea blandensis MED297]